MAAPIWSSLRPLTNVCWVILDEQRVGKTPLRLSYYLTKLCGHQNNHVRNLADAAAVMGGPLYNSKVGRPHVVAHFCG